MHRPLNLDRQYAQAPPQSGAWRWPATLLIVLACLAVPLSAQTRDAGPPEGVEFRFPSGDVTLSGRLWLPVGEGPFPALVFVPGSGRSISDLHVDPQPLPHRLNDDGIALLAFTSGCAGGVRGGGIQGYRTSASGREPSTPGSGQ